MKRFFVCLLVCAGCHHSHLENPLSFIQIHDRNGLTETISTPDRLEVYQSVDFFSSHPYQKVLRVYKKEGKNYSKITTYHPNGLVWQYLEAEEMRAHGAYREWFPNGQLKIEATVIGGTADINPSAQEDWLFDSTSYVWDEQGHLIAQIPYEKGMLQGTSLYFYPSAQIHREVPFVKNEIEGEVTEFTPEGSLKSKINYRKGIKEGASVGFFDSQKVAWVETYVEGSVQTGRYYSPNEELISEIQNGFGSQAFYENGSLTLVEHRAGHPEGLVQKYTRFGELQKSYHIKNGKKQGEEIEYYLSSDLETGDKQKKPQPKLSILWHENAIHGSVKTWYPNGQLRSQREYSRNQKSGPSLAWYQNGNFMLLEEYEEGILTSGQYFKIHKQEPISTIINGNGIATLYDEMGALIRKITYLKGKPVDPES